MRLKNGHAAVIALIIALLLLSLSTAGAAVYLQSPYVGIYSDILTIEIVEPTPPPEPEKINYPDDWTCFDYAMNYSKEYPEWGIVVISNNPRFQGYPDPTTLEGNNHFVNYQIIDEKLLIHDEKSGAEYTAIGWQYDTLTFEYYHFYVNGEIPTRTWRILRPNAEVTYNGL